MGLVFSFMSGILCLLLKSLIWFNTFCDVVRWGGSGSMW